MVIKSYGKSACGSAAKLVECMNSIPDAPGSSTARTEIFSSPVLFGDQRK